MGFDLGIRGSYEQLYAWLDDHHAKECGDGLAFLEFEFEGDLITKLRKEMAEIVGGDKRSRIYVIYQETPAGPNKKIKGKFIVGGRKSPPWAGFGAGGKQEIDQ